jgi:hypothetical protein
LDLVLGRYRDAGKLQDILCPYLHALINCRIVEYATRDQAQNAIQTLSNQSLMGRLVYVREVRLSLLSEHHLMLCRIERLSHASLDPHQAEVTLAVAAASVVATVAAEAMAAAVPPWVVELVSSTFPMFVHPFPTCSDPNPGRCVDVSSFHSILAGRISRTYSVRLVRLISEIGIDLS